MQDDNLDKDLMAIIERERREKDIDWSQVFSGSVEEEEIDNYRAWREKVPARSPEGGNIGTVDVEPINTPAGYSTKFPFDTPRPGQLEAVDQVLNAFQDGHNALLCAGTGFGKSPVMMALAAATSSAWVLVGGRDLVEQYKRDYQHLSHIGFLKSRQSFRCCVIPEQNCGEANKACQRFMDGARSMVKGEGGLAHKEIQDMIKKGKSSKDAAQEWLRSKKCLYSTNRDYALSKPITVMTTAMALTIFRYLKKHPAMLKRRLLVIDESSEMENELLRFFELSISSRRIAKLIKKPELFADSKSVLAAPKTVESAKEWMLKAQGEVDDWVSEKKNLGVELSDDEGEEVGAIKRSISQTLHGMSLGIPYHLEVESITNKIGDGHMPFAIRLAPLEARGFFDKALGNMADYSVFCSATTGPAELFQATHGMERPTAYIEAGTPFPAANRPVYHVPIGSLTRKNIDANLPLVAQKCVDIAKWSTDAPDGRHNHLKQKGVIHTYTNRITDAVVDAFRKAGMLKRCMILRGGGPQRMELLEAFKHDPEPKILISPSAMIGLSLDDDLGRWQVIVKTPYAHLGTPAVAYRKDTIDGWYSWQTTKDLIQTFGRIVRSPEDWGTTYILDTAFENHWRWNQDQFPYYIKNAIQFVKPKPPPPPEPLPTPGI